MPRVQRVGGLGTERQRPAVANDGGVFPLPDEGRPAEGIALMEPVLSGFTGGQAFRSILMIRLAEAHLVQNEVARAREIAQAGVKVASASGQHGYEAWGRRLLAQVELASATPDLDRAERDCRDALDRASELGMRPLVAYCNVTLGQVEAARGRSGEARAHFATAGRLAQEMGMRLPPGVG